MRKLLSLTLEQPLVIKGEYMLHVSKESKYQAISLSINNVHNFV